MEKEQANRATKFFREFMIFFAVLFFTCVVGIITLLPEFEKTNGLFSWSWLIISAIYFGLLLGIDYSLHICFHLYGINRWFRENVGVGFFFPDLDYVVRSIQKIPKKVSYRQGLLIIDRFLIAVIALVFFLLYLVKIGVLK